MRKLGIIAISFLLALCPVSCGKSGESASDTLSLRLEKESVSCNSDGIFVYVEASGFWSLSLEDGNGSAVSWASLSKISGYGNSNSVLSYEYNKTASDRTLVVRLSSTASKSVTKLLTQKSFNSDIDPPAEVPSWMELPAQNSSLGFYSHSFNYNGRQYRNYSFAYDAKNRVASWVAYPLCPFYTAKKVNRVDLWDFDPDVPSTVQPNLQSSYHGSYDRGHQLPSADRLVCREANAQTFYFTNMTPQASVFNQGVWGNLENSVRAWADKSDTLYVVTGCVMEGSSSSTLDSAGNECPIPSAYFKAVLRYSRSATIGWGGYVAAGLYFRHTGGSTSVSKSNIKSIKELEGILGYSLFVNLEEKLGKDLAARVKSQDPTTVSFWGF